MGHPPQICRPDKLTSRWVYEITSAIHRVCPSHLIPIQLPKNTSSVELDQVYFQYLMDLKLTHCYHDPIVKQILSFDIDYNQILKGNH